MRVGLFFNKNSQSIKEAMSQMAAFTHVGWRKRKDLVSFRFASGNIDIVVILHFFHFLLPNILFTNIIEITPPRKYIIFQNVIYNDDEED